MSWGLGICGTPTPCSVDFFNIRCKINFSLFILSKRYFLQNIVGGTWSLFIFLMMALLRISLRLQVSIFSFMAHEFLLLNVETLTDITLPLLRDNSLQSVFYRKLLKLYRKALEKLSVFRPMTFQFRLTIHTAHENSIISVSQYTAFKNVELIQCYCYRRIIYGKEYIT